MKLIKVKLNKLKPDKKQPRKIFLGIKELSESMELKGQLTPIIITKDKLILDGHRRYYASKGAGITELEAIIVSPKVKMTPFIKKSLPFSINIEREGFSPYEMGEAIVEIYWDYFLEEYKPKSRNDNGVKTFAEYMGMSTTATNDIIKTYTVAKKSRHLREVLKAKDLPFSTIKEIAKSPIEDHNHYINIVRKGQENAMTNRVDLRDQIRDERIFQKLKEKEELPINYHKRIILKAHHLISLLHNEVLRKLEEKESSQIKKAFTPIIKFYDRL